jgi:hydroxymethylpyrimidine/phosphomethylpyrimidine kinase
MELNQVTVPCTDYAASVEFYTRLGLVQIVDSPPRYARFESSAGSTLSIHAAEEGAPAHAATVYFEVPDVDLAVAEIRARGLEFESDPVNQQWLWREAYLRDPANNRICIYHAGENRRHPPWRVDA